MPRKGRNVFCARHNVQVQQGIFNGVIVRRKSNISYFGIKKYTFTSFFDIVLKLFRIA